MNLERVSRQPVRYRFALLTLVFLSGLSAGARGVAAPNTFRIDISPKLDAVRPLEDLVNIQVAVEHQARGAVDLFLRLLAPERGGPFTTDFPLVEGTELIAMTVRLPDGRLDLSYAFPIRGTYRLELKAVDAAGSSAARTVLLQVGENWMKWAYLVGFLVFLFALGVVAGRLFTGGPALSACVLVAVLGFLTFGRVGNAATDVQPTLRVAAAGVGSLTTIRWDVGEQQVEGARLTINITQLEKNQTVFRLHRLPTQGNFEFGYQFTDASAHRVAATVQLESGNKLAEVEERVEVWSSDPALGDRLQPVVVSLLVVIAGLITGKLSQRRALAS